MCRAAELDDRFDSFTALVADRVERLGQDPTAVLIVCRTRLMLAAITVPSGLPVAFMSYMGGRLQADAPIEGLADQFVVSWLAQIQIDARCCA